jgi:hypothetical protein
MYVYTGGYVRMYVLIYECTDVCMHIDKGTYEYTYVLMHKLIHIKITF